mmetsp:Transcript_20171/g.19484  ORF Transcript_20171/g.19484 Transcript_20171/m.19484 type:complete len:2393 (+) Transcript_20171:111-7289(+)
MVATVDALARRISPVNEDDSDFSDFEADDYDLEDEIVNNNWLNEANEEELSTPVPTSFFSDMLKGKTAHQRAYVTNNSDLYRALCEVESLEFSSLVAAIQIVLMKSLVVQRFQPGEKIFSENEMSLPFYFVVASEETADTAEVEVLKDAGGSEKLMTRLRRGQYFGQKYFLTKQRRVRSATVRVPFDGVSIDIACLLPEQFTIWESYRNILLVQGVPLIQSIPRSERIVVISHAVIKAYKTGDCIIKQGDMGEEFFIILEGACDVWEDKNFKLNSSSDQDEKMRIKSPHLSKVVTLREGHFFGEMALVSNDPRMASVTALTDTVCLGLSRAVFRSALSSARFAELLYTVINQRKKARKKRQIENHSRRKGRVRSHSQNPEVVLPESLFSNSTPQSSTLGFEVSTLPVTTGSDQSPSYANPAASLSTTNSVTLTSSVKMRKLSSGDKLVNKYLVVRELGRGATGEVYMVRDEETGQSYAMKVTNRYAAGWSEDSQRDRSIALEIAVMKKLQHENIVNLIEVIDDPKNRKIFLVQELMEGGALMPDLEKQDPMSNEVAWKYFRDIVAGLAYLHAEGVIHRDIKPQNILLTSDGKAKIADFGAAVFVEAEDGKVAYAGTPAFMSPELFMSSEVAAEFSKSPAIDIFALGATLFCMVVGNPPWMANNQIEIAHQISNVSLEFPDNGNLDPHLKHLLCRMLEKDPEVRIDLDGIVEDDWVTHEGMDPFFFEGGPGDLDFTEVDDVNPDENIEIEAGLQEDVTQGLQEDVEVKRVLTPNKSSSCKHASMKLRDNGHVLIIDDSPVARKLLSIQVYRATGYQACATASGAEALEMLKMIEMSGGVPFDAILIDHKMTHYSPEGREKVSMDGVDTAIAIRATGFKGRLIGMCGSNSGIYGGSREAFKERGHLRLILKKPLNTNHLKEAILDTADEAVVALKFIQQRDLLKTKDINMAIKRLSVHSVESSPSSRLTPHHSGYSSPHNTPQESPRLKFMPDGRTPAVQFDENDTIINQDEFKNYSLDHPLEQPGVLSTVSSTCSIGHNFEDGVGYIEGLAIERTGSDDELVMVADKMSNESRSGKCIYDNEHNLLIKKGSMSEKTMPSMSDLSRYNSFREDLNLFPPKPEKVSRSQTGPTRSRQGQSSDSISHFTPSNNDFQWNLKTPNKAGKLPTSELSLNSLDFYSLDWKSNASAREEELYDSEKGPPSDTTSLSRRGSGTSNNMSSNNSIDSMSPSIMLHHEYQEGGNTLFMDRAVSNSNRDLDQEMRHNTSNNSIISPHGRTLTRTQDFMVVPSEVVYGPGGEKINRGIAYTALDGRMNSVLRIPVNSSYQEEAEARRMKREKAMMKSKMMRPSFPSDKWSLVDTSRRSPAVNGRLDTGRSSSMHNDSGGSSTPPSFKGRRKKEQSSGSIGSKELRGGTNRSSQRSGASNVSSDTLQKIVVDRTPSDRSVQSIGRASNVSSDSYTDSIGQRDKIKGDSSQPNSRPGSQSNSRSGSLLEVNRGDSSQLDSKKGSRSKSRRNSSTSVDSMGIQIVKSKDDIDSDEEGRSGGMSGSRHPSSTLSLPGEISLSSSAQSSHLLISGRRKISDPSSRDSSERYMDMGVVIDTSIPHDMPSPTVTLGEIKRAQIRFHGDPEASDTKITRPISSLSLTSGYSPHISSDEIVSSGEDLDSLGSSQVSTLGEHSPRSRSLSPHRWPFKKNKSFIIVRTNSQSMMNLGPLDNVNEWEEYENASPPLTTPVGELAKSQKESKSQKEIVSNENSSDKSNSPARRCAFTTRDKSASCDYENEEMEEYDGEVDEWYYMEDQVDSPCSDGRGKDNGNSNSINHYDDDDDDDDDDYGLADEEIVQLDNEMLASALEDLCVQKTQKDLTETSWNYVREDSDITSNLQCPSSQENIQLGLRFGKAEAIGGRQYMEDRIFANAAMVLPEHKENPHSLNVNQLAFFGVFDGHNGEYVAEMLQCQMAETLQSYIMPDSTGIASSESRSECEAVWQLARTRGHTIEKDADVNDSEVPPMSILGECFIHTAADLDLQILTRDYQRQQCSLHTGTLDVQTFAGCVLATMTATSRIPNPPSVSPIRNQAPYSPLTATPGSSPIRSSSLIRSPMSHTPPKEGDRDSLCLSLTPDKDPHRDRILDDTHDIDRKDDMDIDKKGDIDIDRWAENRGMAAGMSKGGDQGSKEKTDGDLRNKVNIMVGHTGDCRIVLSEKGGIARDLTIDHKPINASEKERIEAAGGWVHNNRVNSVLAVSRSFGDIQYKMFDGSIRFLAPEEEGGIWSKTQQVISKPEILEFDVEANHEFVVIASDGLWDVFTSQECINFVRWQLGRQGGDLEKTAEALVEAAFNRGTADNTSVIICAFNQTENPSSPRGKESEAMCPIIRPGKVIKERKKSFIDIKLG